MYQEGVTVMHVYQKSKVGYVSQAAYELLILRVPICEKNDSPHCPFPFKKRAESFLPRRACVANCGPCTPELRLDDQTEKVEKR